MRSACSADRDLTSGDPERPIFVVARFVVTQIELILSELPNELLLAVADKLESSGDIFALARTRTTLHKLLIPYLFRFDAARPQSDALYFAARLNRESVCRNALQAGANPMAKYNGDTVLHVAAEFDHDRIARLLLAMPSVNPNCKGYYGLTPLGLAVTAGSLRTLRLLVAHDGVDPQPIYQGRTPLIQAVMSKRVDIMRILLAAKGIDPEIPDHEGMSPLI
ncbi:Ankyrin repeat-containing domain [Penicillium roqueforti FM164]|uniref:Ankyrin repeat-containing domain n=1 Tax=Penicillium roqueforti (strain FM164) TaxID=1365484 RepID=W6QC43_PENRF|nr:Ankyrin repeat-containing domain [Penicillium roqueforti FM164]